MDLGQDATTGFFSGLIVIGTVNIWCTKRSVLIDNVNMLQHGQVSLSIMCLKLHVAVNTRMSGMLLLKNLGVQGRKTWMALTLLLLCKTTLQSTIYIQRYWECTLYATKPIEKGYCVVRWWKILSPWWLTRGGLLQYIWIPQGIRINLCGSKIIWLQEKSSKSCKFAPFPPWNFFAVQYSVVFHMYWLMYTYCCPKFFIWYREQAYLQAGMAVIL